ncbi:3-oxoadipate enol-lactonase [Lysobacter enzymogenes]|uniref:3-oxoadipate enol-lactonase n=1 Tax=Lysobacter enzymogenes TaxID=69 RepID=A0A0S2DBU0_LYSEN|nr:3-oxoadipate enol-lactonase [Lysobacter enzymogenes]ALN56009.1 3-oxoadipate enol-lactonase [Lysobacter enzymogenes]QCW24951.1 3-oxoadipate enol-lactonase [Lysobacter enzymogenes]
MSIVAAVPNPVPNPVPNNVSGHVVAGDGTRIAYRFDGDSERPVLVLSNSIATDLHMWDAQIPALSARFRVLRYDARGHGGSDAPAGAYSLDRLGRDVLELLDALGLERVHFLGLSLGGFVGQWLAIHAPQRIDRLVLSNTSAHLGPAAAFDERIREALAAPDMSAIAARFLRDWFPPAMLDSADPRIEPFRDALLAMRATGLAGSFAAVRDADLRRTAASIAAPTLVIAGRSDPVTLAEHGRVLAETVPGARFLLLPAVHMANIECADAFERAVIEFLTA